MKRRIKKIIKIFIFGTVGLLLLTAGLWFAVSEYYLPSYVEKNVLPKLARECGYRGFSGKVKSIGLFGANLGKMSLKFQDKTVFEAENVKISYSPRRLYYLRHFVIESMDFTGVKLDCSLQKDQMLMNGIKVKEFLELIKGNFSRKNAKELPLTVKQIKISGSKVSLDWKKYKRLLPFKAELVPQDDRWDKFTVKLSLFDADKAMVLSPVIDLGRNRISVQSPLKCNNETLFELGHDLNVLPQDYSSQCQGVFSGNLSINAALTPLQLHSLKMAGSLDNTRVADRMFQMRPARRASGSFMPMDLLLQWKRNQWQLKLSAFELQKPFNGRIENFSCVLGNQRNPCYLLSGTAYVNLAKLNFMQHTRMQMLDDFALRREFELTFFKNSTEWIFKSPRAAISKSSRGEIFARLSRGALLAMRGGMLAVSGRGKGYRGRVDLQFSCPEISCSLRENEAKNWHLQKLRGSSCLKFAGSASTLESKFDIDKFSFYQDLNCLRLDKCASASSKLEIKDVFSLTPELKSASFTVNTDELEGFSGRNHAKIGKLNVSLNLPSVKTLKNISVKAEFDKAGATVLADSFEIGKVSLNGSEKNLKASIAKLGMQRGGRHLSAGEIDLNLENTGPVKDSSLIPRQLKLIASISKNFTWRESGDRSLSGSGAAAVCSMTFKPRARALRMLKSISATLKLKDLHCNDSGNSLNTELLSTTASASFIGRNDTLSLTDGSLRLFSPAWNGSNDDYEVNAGGLLLRLELSDGSKAVWNGSLRGLSCKAKSRHLDLNISELALKAASTDVFGPGVRHQGDLNIKDGVLALPENALALRGIDAQLPFDFQSLRKEGFFALAGGLCKFGSFEIKAFNCGSGELELKKLSQREFSLRADFVNKLIPEAKIFGFGKIKADEEGKLSLEGDVLMPKYTSSHEFSMGRFFPELDGVSVGGTISAKGSFSCRDGAFDHQLQLNLANAMFKSNDFSIKGLNFNCAFKDIFSFKSEPSQKLSYDALLLDGVRLRKGKLDVQLESLDRIHVSSHNFHFAGGSLRARDMYIERGRDSYSMNLLAQELSLPQTLDFLGVAKDAAGNGTLDGIIPLTYRGGRIIFRNAKLFSVPGSGSANLKIKQLVQTPGNGSAPGASALFRAAMADFNYNVVRLDFFGSLNKDLCLRFITDGSPAAPLPFYYDSKSGSFVKAAANSGSMLSGSMHFDSIFNLGPAPDKQK